MEFTSRQKKVTVMVLLLCSPWILCQAWITVSAPDEVFTTEEIQCIEWMVNTL
jgi:hypothetical protein